MCPRLIEYVIMPLEASKCILIMKILPITVCFISGILAVILLACSKPSEVFNISYSCNSSCLDLSLDKNMKVRDIKLYATPIANYHLLDEKI